jgi:glycosyltransferase involved in cell wall biosynthesis
MKILFVTDTVDCWKHGIWFHRQQIPSQALSMRGHGIKQVAMGATFPAHLMEWPDVVIFGRTYPAQYEPIKIMRDYKKLGKRVIYDMDDDFWQVSKDNPSVNVSNAMKDQYEGMIREADAVITPSSVLAKKFRKYFKKPVFICPNGIDYDVYRERPHESKDLVVGYMGAASHWKDLQIIGEVVSKLAEKYSFVFKIYGLVGEPLEAAMYAYDRILHDNLMPEKNPYYKSAIDFYNTLKNIRMWHVPFMPPELHPSVLSRCDFDIGIAPLEDTTFNNGKSCIKYYEYASVGTVVVASNVLPYSEEVPYLAKNTFKDWYAKLEKLIVDEEFRLKLLKEQQTWVKENRSTDAIGLFWEKACQRPGGLEVLNQQ